MDEFIEKFNQFKDLLEDSTYFTSSSNHPDVNEGYNEAVDDIREKFYELGLDKAF